MTENSSLNMGIIWSMLKGTNEDEDDQINLQARPEIKLKVIYEHPEGAGQNLDYTLDQTMSTADFKAVLSKSTCVPVESIILQYKNEELNDDKSLRAQKIVPDAILVMRDSRETYHYI